MARTGRVKELALVVIFSAITCSTPGAEELQHHGVRADAEGNAFECLSCHDGLIASQVHMNTKLGNYFCNHPVNRDYPPPENSDYLPLESVTGAGIRLLHGQITCISCHNLKNSEKYHLVVPLDNSNLCFNCHKI